MSKQKLSMIGFSITAAVVILSFVLMFFFHKSPVRNLTEWLEKIG